MDEEHDANSENDVEEKRRRIRELNVWEGAGKEERKWEEEQEKREMGPWNSENDTEKEESEYEN